MIVQSCGAAQTVQGTYRKEKAGAKAGTRSFVSASVIGRNDADEPKGLFT